MLLCDPYHRTLNQECLKQEHPKTLDEVCQVTEAFARHYNWQRPHQGISCGNQPPRVAFPTLPSLPSLPDLVDPDAWLSQVKGQHLVRRINRQGFVKVDLYPYYISSKLGFEDQSPYPSRPKGRACRWSISRSIVALCHSKAYTSERCPIKSISHSCSGKPRREPRLLALGRVESPL